MKEIVFNDPRVGPWVTERAQAGFNPALDTSIGLVESGKVVGGVVYTCYTGVSMFTHIAGEGPHWLTRDFLWCIAHYPFEQLGCGTLFSFVEAERDSVVRFDMKLGWKVHSRVPGMFASGDGLLLSMRRENCRWLRLKPRGLQEGGSDGRR